MIVYSLHCRKGHSFEGWFVGIAAFETQKASGKLVCPVCNSRKVTKAPMAPALTGGAREQTPALQVPAPAENKLPALPAAPDDLRKMRQFMTGLRQYVRENAEYVGPKFPEEARKIHYGETEERRIYGEASLREAAELVEEGIDVAPLPPDLDEMN